MVAAGVASIKSLSEETKKVEELDQIEHEFWQDEKRQIRAEQQAMREQLAEASARLAAGSAKLDEGRAKLAENHAALVELDRKMRLFEEALKQLPPSPQVFSADAKSTADKCEYKDRS
jgi:uncharacterized coiled-coil DUF342 family protein